MKNKSSNKISNMDNNLDILNNIKKVEASPFLLNRIQQKIEAEKQNTISTKWVYAMAASVLILLSLNVFAIVHKTEKNEAKAIAKNMHLLTNDNFYNEQ